MCLSGTFLRDTDIQERQAQQRRAKGSARNMSKKIYKLKRVNIEIFSNEQNVKCKQTIIM
jgi:hypothetical protein